MAWKNLKQLSLADSLTSENEALTELDDINDLMNWQTIEHLLGDIHVKRRGNSAWPPVFMFKALLLQSWYNLSDPRLERRLVRDRLFRRFVNLSLADSVSDHSSIWRFRQLLEKQGLMDSLLVEINRQLSIQGLYIRVGEINIVDASVIQAQPNRPNKDKDGNSTQDPEADWKVKQGADGKCKSTYGFKAHVNVDEDEFIKATAFTVGNVHDSNHFIDLLSDKESEVYAYSAYKSQKHEKKKSQRHSGTRCTVERMFWILKSHYGMGQARYLGLARNRIRFGLCVWPIILVGAQTLRNSVQPHTTVAPNS